MHEVEAVERMRLVLDAAVHMHAAAGAGMALNGSACVYHFQLLRILGDRELVAADDGHLTEGRTARLPALGAAADMVERGLRADGDLDRITGAFADQRAAGKTRLRGLHAAIDRRMNLYCHLSVLPLPYC